MRKSRYITPILLIGLLLCCACKEANQERIEHLVNEWNEKEIQFPAHSIFTPMGKRHDSFFR